MVNHPHLEVALARSLPNRPNTVPIKIHQDLLLQLAFATGHSSIGGGIRSPSIPSSISDTLTFYKIAVNNVATTSRIL